MLAPACEDLSSSQASQPAIVLMGVKLRHYDGNGTVTHAWAEEVTYLRERGTLSARGLTASLPAGPRVRRGGVELKAALAEGDLSAREAVAYGGVEATTGAGDHMTTEEARLDFARDELRADVPVLLAGKGYSLAARGYRLHLHEERLELLDGVTAVSSGARR